MLDEGSPKMVIYIYMYISSIYHHIYQIKKKNLERSVKIEFILVFYKMAEDHIVIDIINLHFFSTGS